MWIQEKYNNGIVDISPQKEKPFCGVFSKQFMQMR
jgi:hypothetical protein